MGNYLKLIMALIVAIGLSSCSYTPEERAEKTVKEFCKAIKDGNVGKQYSLTYHESDYINYDEVVVEEVIEEGVEEVDEDEIPASKLNIIIKPNQTIDKDTEIEIRSIQEIFNRNTSLVEEVAVEAAEEAVSEENYIYISDGSWPSKTMAAFNVCVEAKNKNARPSVKLVVFTVIQLGEKDFKIYKIKGLEVYDFSATESQLGCEIHLKEASDDEEMANKVAKFISNIKMYDIFSNAVENKDTALYLRLFPKLKNVKYSLSDSIKATKYVENDGTATIIVNDSLQFLMSNDGEIVDCYGVISFDKEYAAINDLGGAPDHQSSWDLTHLDKLKNQINALEREKARKALAAKYKAQGIALVNSHFSTGEDGAKGVDFTIVNTSNKTAKYVIMEVVGYNAVDDPVWDGGYLQRCRGIGPIEPGEVGEWDFNKIWTRGSIVRDYQIKTLIIQFTDGTSKSVKLPTPLPSGWRDWLY